jgi:hypothetical protein
MATSHHLPLLSWTALGICGAASSESRTRVASRHAVAAKTYAADAALPRLAPTFLGAPSVGAVTDREVTRAWVALSRSGLAVSSVHRFREWL